MGISNAGEGDTSSTSTNAQSGRSRALDRALFVCLVSVTICDYSLEHFEGANKADKPSPTYRNIRLKRVKRKLRGYGVDVDLLAHELKQRTHAGKSLLLKSRVARSGGETCFSSGSPIARLSVPT